MGRGLLRDLIVTFLPPGLSFSTSRIRVSVSIRPALRKALAAMFLDPEALEDVENIIDNKESVVVDGKENGNESRQCYGSNFTRTQPHHETRREQ